MILILSAIIVLLLIVIAAMWCARPIPVVIEEEMPKKDEPRYRIMKLQNELAKYTYIEDGKVKIKVFENEKK